MKNSVIALLCIFIISGCAKKTVPSKPNTFITPNKNSNNSQAITPGNNTVNANVTTDSVSVAPAALVMVVADGYGKLVTPKQNLPQDENIQYNSLQLSKGFTAQQRTNLQTRYHAVPPRVLYVSAQYTQHSLKGNYYILRKKFWYWKKSDGLFYLDEKYYR